MAPAGGYPFTESGSSNEDPVSVSLSWKIGLQACP
jgi:hypothetical protein